MSENKDSYRDNILLKKVGVQVKYTQEQVEEYLKCAKDPVYFAEHYITVSYTHLTLPTNREV